MEETLKKALKTGIETLISVTEEVRHGLTVLDRDIQDLSRRVAESNTAEKANVKLDELIEKSVAAIRDYERRATEISQSIQKHLSEVDPMARQSVEELSEKLNGLAQSLKVRNPSSSQKA
jgi:hypothetical protein